MGIFPGTRGRGRALLPLGGLVLAVLALLLYDATPHRPGAGIRAVGAQGGPTPSPTPVAAPKTPTTPAQPAPQRPAGAPAQASGQGPLTLRVPRAAYVSGANPPAVGQTTRVAVTVEVANTGNEPLDLSHSVVCDLGPAVALGGAMLTRGAARLEGRTATWDGFGLMPGEGATLTMTLDITPPAGTAGQSLLVVGDVVATARTPTGALVEVSVAGLATDGLAGIANRGLVTVTAAPAPAPAPAPARAAAPAPAAAAAAPAAPTTPTVGAAAQAAPSAAALPRTGTGLGADAETAGALPSLVALTLTLTAVSGFALRRRRLRVR